MRSFLQTQIEFFFKSICYPCNNHTAVTPVSVLSSISVAYYCTAGQNLRLPGTEPSLDPIPLVLLPPTLETGVDNGLQSYPLPRSPVAHAKRNYHRASRLIYSIAGCQPHHLPNQTDRVGATPNS